MRNIYEKWIPQCLNIDQTLARAGASRSPCAGFEKDTNFLTRVDTVDES